VYVSPETAGEYGPGALTDNVYRAIPLPTIDTGSVEKDCSKAAAIRPTVPDIFYCTCATEPENKVVPKRPPLYQFRDEIPNGVPAICPAYVEIVPWLNIGKELPVAVPEKLYKSF